MINAPCYKCEDRYPGCHSKCEKPEYKKYVAKRHLAIEAKSYERWSRTTTHHWKDIHSQNNGKNS